MTRSAWLLTLLLALGGCRFSDLPAPPEWEEELELHSNLPAPRPAPYRVGVLLPRFEYDPSALYQDDSFRHASRPDALRFREGLLRALNKAELFARAEPRGAPGDKLEIAEREAWDANDDLLLELELLDYHQVYLGRGEGYFPWLATYVSWVFPAIWIPSEKFSGGMTLRVRLRDVQGRHEALVDEIIRVVPGQEKGDAHENERPVDIELTPLERGLVGFVDLGAIYNLHASLDSDNWQLVENSIGPRSRRQLEVKLLKLLNARVTTPLSRSNQGLTSRASKRLALSVGVTQGADPRLGDCAHAEADAHSIAALWETPAGGGLVAGRELKTLLGEQATRPRVLGAIAAIGSRASASDEVIVYVAAQGTTTEAGPSLLLHDASHDDLAGSTLSLAELGAALRTLKAGKVLLILDTSFHAGSSGRTFAGTQSQAEPEQLRELLALGPGRTVILAAQPNEGAQVLSGGEAGLFTQILKEGVAGRADTDGDGRVTLSELYGYLQLEVPNQAALERHEQTPLAIGLPELNPEDSKAQQAQFGWPR